MATRTITGLFDTRREAEMVVETLVQRFGLDRSRVRIHASEGGTTATAASTGAITGAEGRGAGGDDRGFWASLKDLFVPDEDRAAYAEGLRRGGVVVSAEVDEAHLDRVMDAFEEHGAVDLDSREAEWRSSGWSGQVATSPAHPGLGVAATGAAAATTGAAAMGTTGAATGTAATARAGEEQSIPIVEEQVRVGKRVAESGRVRVRSYVVETPVQEQVTLREEHVDVSRRAVDRPVTDADALFQERVIEATETSEEAVVAKEARVKEELVIRKDAAERTQTVQDTVRRTEVEVVDERGEARSVTGGATTGATGKAPGAARGTGV